MYKLYWLFKTSFLIEWSYKLNNLLRIGNLLFYTAIFYFLGGFIDQGQPAALQPYGGQYFTFVLVGLIINWYSTEAQNTFAANIREQQVMGTLEPLVATGTGLFSLLSGLAIFDFFLTTLQVVVIVLVAVFFMGLQIAWLKILVALGIILISIAAFWGLGVISAACVLVFKKGDPLSWLLGNVSALIGGVYYPVESLPPFWQHLSAMLPITYALKATRAVLLQGANLYQVRNELVILGIFAVVILLISYFILQYALNRVTREGSLIGY